LPTPSPVVVGLERDESGTILVSTVKPDVFDGNAVSHYESKGSKPRDSVKTGQKRRRRRNRRRNKGKRNGAQVKASEGQPVHAKTERHQQAKGAQVPHAKADGHRGGKNRHRHSKGKHRHGDGQQAKPRSPFLNRDGSVDREGLYEMFPSLRRCAR
jgi:hypothetical protein